MLVFAPPQNILFKNSLGQQRQQAKRPFATKLNVGLVSVSSFTTVESLNTGNFIHQGNENENTFVNFNALALNDSRNSAMRFHRRILFLPSRESKSGERLHGRRPMNREAELPAAA